MRRSALAAVALLAAPWVARAHIEPVLPSACRLDPVQLSQPATGTTITADAATAADDLRVTYDTGASQASLCPAVASDATACGTAAARHFTVGGVDVSVTLPAAFALAMWASGDLDAAAVPLTFAVGGAPAVVPVTLTTGLAVADGTIVAGEPIASGGDVVLVGVVPAGTLPAPLDAHALVLRAGCQLSPAPDLDQFTLPARVSRVGGRLSTRGGRLRATIALPPSPAADVGAGPTVLRVHAGDQTLVGVVVPGGLHGKRRRLGGRSDDGRATLTLRPHGADGVVLGVVLHDVAVPAQTPRAQLDVAFEVDLGGMLARGERRFRASASGQQLRPH